MHVESESVAGPVEETDGALGGGLGFKTMPGKNIEALLVNVATVDAGAHGGECRELGVPHGGDEGMLGVTGAAFEKCAGHVAVVTGGGDARENIDDDECVGAQGAVAVFMWITGLIAAGGDGVGRVGTGLEAGDFYSGLQALGREGASVEDEFAGFYSRISQEAFGGGDTGGAAAITLTKGADLGGGFYFAFGKKLCDGGERQAVCAQAITKTGGEIVGDRKGFGAVAGGEERDDLGGTGAVAGPLFLSAGSQRLERNDFVETRCFAGASVFECIEHSDFFAMDAQGDHGIGHIEPAEVEQIGATGGVGVKQQVGGVGLV